jgi:protoheme IX farnesyltransferase
LAYIDDSSSLPAYSGGARVEDYFELLKPRVMSLVVFTAAIGMLLAPGGINPVIGFIAILSIAIAGGASGALNMWYDSDIDAVMSRGRTEPVQGNAVCVAVRVMAVCRMSVRAMAIYTGVAVRGVAVGFGVAVDFAPRLLAFLFADVVVQCGIDGW